MSDLLNKLVRPEDWDKCDLRALCLDAAAVITQKGKELTTLRTSLAAAERRVDEAEGTIGPLVEQLKTYHSKIRALEGALPDARSIMHDTWATIDHNEYEEIASVLGGAVDTLDALLGEGE